MNEKNVSEDPPPSGDKAAQILQHTLDEVAARHAVPGTQQAFGAPHPAGGANGSEWVGKCAKALVRFAEGFAARKLYTVSLQATNDKDFAVNIVQETVATDEQLNLIEELSTTVARKHSIDANYAPEATLCVVVGSLFLNWHHALGRLEKIAADNQRKSAAAKKQSTETLSAN